MPKPFRAILVAAAFAAAPAFAANTTPVHTYTAGLTNFVENSAGTVIYATNTAGNTIVVINPVTLATITTINVGTLPVELCLSPDESKLYVANQGSNFLSVINTATNSATTPIALGAPAIGVQAGTNNRLWVLTGAPNQFDNLIQVNVTTFASTTADLGLGTVYGGDIRITPDRNTLYYAQFGLSPDTAYKLDVSGPTAIQTWAITAGGNGESIALSRNGSQLAVSCGGGSTAAPTIYGDAVYNADSTVAGSFAVGAYPTCFAFSPDGAIGYAGGKLHTPDIQLINLQTFQQIGSIQASSDPSQLFIDNSGRFLFADIGTTTAVFAVPEPATLALLALGATTLLTRRRK